MSLPIDLPAGLSAVIPGVSLGVALSALLVALRMWFDHKRLMPKSNAEARDITAAAQDKDWARFQREIGRLVKRCETAENTADEALAGFRACEEREIGLKGRVAELEAFNLGRGQSAAETALLVSAERIVERDKREGSADDRPR